MVAGTGNFSLLPHPLVSTIWEYCATKDVLALALTCRTFQNFVERSMCMVNEKSDGSIWKIPIYFADRCHSVFITCKICPATDTIENGIYDVSVRSRRKHQSAGRDTIVWQAVMHVNDGIQARSHISFRHDPSQEYSLHVVSRCNHGRSFSVKCELEKQLMTTASTQMMENAIKNCLGFQDPLTLLFEDCHHPMSKMRLLTKLYVFCSESLSEESTPFRAFFAPSRVGQDRLSLIKKQILNLFEQVLEQQEPACCVKKLLSREAMSLDDQLPVDPHSSHPPTQNTNVVSTPSLTLIKDFSWKRRTKRQYIDQNDNFLHGQGLEFVARIPLAHKTTGLTCSGSINTDAPCKAMVFFFQGRPSSQISLENQVDGKVFSCHGISGFWTVELDLDKEYEACFLYVVPGKTDCISVEDLQVTLQVVADDDNSDFCFWMDRVLRNGFLDSPNLHHGLFHIALLRAAARALLGHDGERFTTLRQDLEMEGLVTTRDGLQIMVLTCDVMLRDWPEDSVSS